jgi:hypothetical protein
MSKDGGPASGLPKDKAKSLSSALDAIILPAKPAVGSLLFHRPLIGNLPEQ